MAASSSSDSPIIISSDRREEHSVSERMEMEESITVTEESSPGSGAHVRVPKHTKVSPRQATAVPKITLSRTEDPMGPLVLGRDHARSRQARLEKTNLKMAVWAVVLLACLGIVAAYLVLSSEGEEATVWKVADLALFFLLLFMLSRFLTTTAVVILIVSVACFHCWEQVHYHPELDANRGYLKKHARYFAAMFVFCLVCLKAAPYLS